MNRTSRHYAEALSEKAMQDAMKRPGFHARLVTCAWVGVVAEVACAAHKNPTSPGRDGVSPQVSHRQNGIPQHTAAHMLRWPRKPVTSIYADQAG